MSADVVRKIRGLLATAESLAESGHEEAAGAYVTKAHALQQKHSIGAALLAAAADRREAVITRTWVMPGRYGRRKVDLAHAVAGRTGCTGYFQPGSAQPDGAYRFVVFGFPEDVEWAETLTFSLCHQADAALAAATAARPASWEHGRSFAASFLAGFTAVVAARLREAAENAEAEAEAGTAASVAVVLAGKAARVEAEMRASVPRLRTARSTGGTSQSGYDRGRHAGRTATLTRGSVGSSRRRGLDR